MPESIDFHVSLKKTHFNFQSSFKLPYKFIIIYLWELLVKIAFFFNWLANMSCIEKYLFTLVKMRCQMRSGPVVHMYSCFRQVAYISTLLQLTLDHISYSLSRKDTITLCSFSSWNIFYFWNPTNDAFRNFNKTVISLSDFFSLICYLFWSIYAEHVANGIIILLREFLVK